MYTFLHWSLTYYKVVMPDIWSESLGLNAENSKTARIEKIPAQPKLE